MTSAADFVPERTTLPAMREAVQDCRGCDLYRDATQAVFGEGPPNARVAMVGEQPGDKEDLAGRPFVGPAGGLLDRAIEEAGLARDDVYITKVVKHFRFVQRGKKRIHRKPGAPSTSRRARRGSRPSSPGSAPRSSCSSAPPPRRRSSGARSA